MVLHGVDCGTFRRLEIAPKDEPDLWRFTKKKSEVLADFFLFFNLKKIKKIPRCQAKRHSQLNVCKLLTHRNCELLTSTVYHSSVNCYIVITSPLLAYLLPYLLTSFAHTVYRFFYCVIDSTFVYPMCNSVVVFVALLCDALILARSQL